MNSKQEGFTPSGAPNDSLRDLHGGQNPGILKIEADQMHTSHFHTIQSGAGASASSNLVATAKVLVLSEEIGPARGTRMTSAKGRIAFLRGRFFGSPLSDDAFGGAPKERIE
jgi:hypothetical protein